MQTNQQAANVLCTTYPFFDMAWNAFKVPEYYETIIQRYGNQSIVGLMDTYATKSSRRDIKYFHMEDDRLHSQVLVNSQTAGGPGQQVVFTIAASSHVMAGTKDPTQIKFAVMFKDRKYGLITAKNETTPFAHTITVEPWDQNYVISTQNNEQIMIIPVSVVGEGSGQEPGQIKTPGIVFQNTMETVRKDLCITGQMMASWNGKMRLVKGIDKRTGKVTDCWWNELLGDYYALLNNAREIMLITGENITNPTLASATWGSLQGFTGLISSIVAGGNVLPTSKFKINDWKTITLRLDTQRAPTEYWGHMGNNLFVQMQDELKAWFPNGSVQYASFNGSDATKGKADSIRWGFSSFEAYGYSLHMRKLPLFIDPSLMGAPGWKFPGNGIFIPAAMTTDNDGAPTSYVQITQLLGCGYERTFSHWTSGGASWLPQEMRTNGDDKVNFHFLDQFGFEMFKNNCFFYIQKP